MPASARNNNLDPASFRDPSGFVFRRDDTLYRQVNKSYRSQFDGLISSGLYDKLTGAGLLVTHETSDTPPLSDDGYLVIKPQVIPFISYPYEWSFSQLKAAALCTLEIQKVAMAHGQSLKDASTYNIQFVGSKPVLIDTLSIETQDESKPWIAYRQFCQHFLAPLALCSHTDVRLAQLLRTYVDGIPLDLASKLLPTRTRLSFPLLTHIHLHARAQRSHADKPVASARGSMNRRALLGLIDSLESCCRGLEWKLPVTAWSDYYTDTNYSNEAADQKAECVRSMAQAAEATTVWDLGANDGRYSREISRTGAFTVAFDVDPVAVERNWRQVVQEGDSNLLPLLCDLTNPSPGIGWAAAERRSLADRGPVDLVVALALIHHLAIGNNVPLEMIAEYFARLGSWLLVEFVPKEDSQVQRLLASREDIFHHYNEADFEEAFKRSYEIVRREPLQDSSRVMYLMKRAASS
jgi:ribosomal protein L11 methylase PrmA